MRYLYIFLDGSIAKSDDKPTPVDLGAIGRSELTVIYLGGPCYVDDNNHLQPIEETNVVHSDVGPFHENPYEPEEDEDEDDYY